MKGITSEMIQTVFAVLVIIITLGFSMTLEAKPAFDTYGKAQARLLAKNIAYTIDAMQGMEKASVEMDFGVVWDIDVQCTTDCEVVVSYESYRGSKKLLTTVDEMHLFGVSRVVVEKIDGNVVVRGPFEGFGEGEFGGGGTGGGF